MKKLLLFITLLTSSFYAQENFKIENNSIIWQKVFDNFTNLDLKQLQQNPFCANLQFNNVISGTSNYYQFPNKEGLPVFAYQDFKCFILVEEKENKYRVTISNITFKGLEIEVFGVKNKSEEYLSFYALKNNGGELRKNNSITNTLNSLNNFFIETFTLKEIIKSDW